MPKLDGLATAEKIRQLKGRYELVPIIAITAFDTYGMEEAAIDAGCSGYVRKPIHEDEFERVVRRLFPLSF
jgi:CheY-like chemotaxis protein